MQRRLLVVSALGECDIQSAEWLLPKERDFLGLLFGVLVISIRSLVKTVIGVPLLIFGFIKRYAN